MFQGGIANSATTAVISGGNRGIRIENVSSFLGGISNAGLISGVETDGINVYSVALFGSSSAGGGITNTGTINGGGSGIFIGFVSTFVGGISNSGIITGQSGAGIGMFDVASSTFGTFGASSMAGGITNSGTISAFYAGVKLSNVGSSEFFGGITNSGTITAALGDGISIVDVADDGSFSGNIVNAFSGMISSGKTGIYINDVGYSAFSGGIINSGEIAAASGAGISIDDVPSISGGITNTGTISGYDWNCPDRNAGRQPVQFRNDYRHRRHGDRIRCRPEHLHTWSGLQHQR